jgi:hypothetical protein
MTEREEEWNSGLSQWGPSSCRTFVSAIIFLPVPNSAEAIHVRQDLNCHGSEAACLSLFISLSTVSAQVFRHHLQLQLNLAMLILMLFNYAV